MKQVFQNILTQWHRVLPLVLEGKDPLQGATFPVYWQPKHRKALAGDLGLPAYAHRDSTPAVDFRESVSIPTMSTDGKHRNVFRVMGEGAE